MNAPRRVRLFYRPCRPGEACPCLSCGGCGQVEGDVEQLGVGHDKRRIAAGLTKVIRAAQDAESPHVPDLGRPGQTLGDDLPASEAAVSRHCSSMFRGGMLTTVHAPPPCPL